jgi:hypothetical protein
MIIRATIKLHNISRISAIKNTSAITDSLPGEWYATLISTGRTGGLGILFLHNPTMMTVVTLGKSIKKAIKELPLRATSLLIRNGYKDLTPEFQLDTTPEIYSTNCRSILANMNQIRFSLEYSLALSEELEEEDIARVEDLFLNNIVGGKIAKGEYMVPKTILMELLENKAVANTR